MKVSNIKKLVLLLKSHFILNFYFFNLVLVIVHNIKLTFLLTFEFLSIEIIFDEDFIFLISSKHLYPLIISLNLIVIGYNFLMC